MRILVATGIFPPQIGGPATYSKLLYDELPKRGIDVEIASFGDHIDKPKLIRHFLYFLELLKKAPDVDLIYAQDPVSVGLPALLASQIRGKKLALKIVGDYAWEQGTQRFGITDTLDDFARAYQRYPWQVKVMKKIEKYVADGASKIIVPSKYLKGVVSAWGVDPDKIGVIYNGFRAESPKALRPSLRKKLGLEGGVVVTVGRLVPWKGMKELIEAMAEVKKSIPDAKLVVIGDGPERQRLEEAAALSGIASDVTFTGRLGQKVLFEYVKAADAFALNTSYEGFSHQILETMAIGTPVITTAIGGNPEAIENGVSGVLLAPNDKAGFAKAIIEILSEKAVAFVYSKEAKKAVSRFSDEAMLENIARELKTL
ncbi:MAG: glycosyltransferase family 4 protein [Candidatus Taylorbacteria bacterium]|nr:glycosyltransferase family 4 protein [Candidatus Taylorbacteria bacterium]